MRLGLAARLVPTGDAGLQFKARLVRADASQHYLCKLSSMHSTVPMRNVGEHSPRRA